MTHFATRLLEVHSHHVWDQDHLRRVMDFAAGHGLTGIALHRNDIVDEVVYPAAFFGASAARAYGNIHERYQDTFRRLYRLTPHRRSRPNIRRDFLVWVGAEAAARGLALWLENKEIWYPDILPELYSEVLVDGRVCPTHPFWPGFLEAKYRELVVDLPHIAGVITSPATREGRLSISGNLCGCPRCQATSPGDWYRRVLTAVHGPLAAADKRLAVRDFVFDAAAHAEIAQAVAALPSGIIVSLKNTPHDYYPTFPHNPRIGRVGSHPQWVEFDAMGQYFGWGIAPAIMIEDLRDRLRHALAQGVEGVLVRTDWESLDGHTCFRTPNLLNLYGAAALAQDPDHEARRIYAAWLDEQGGLPPTAPASVRDRCQGWIESIFSRTWDVTRRTVYTNDCVFSDSSTLPVSLDHAWWLAEEKNSLRDWDAAKRDALLPTDENIALIQAEKQDALQLWEALDHLVQENPGLGPDAHRDLVQRFRIFGLYVRAFSLVGQAAILARRLIDGLDGRRAPNDIERYGPLLREHLANLRHHEHILHEFRATRAGRPMEYSVWVLLNPERLHAFVEDVERSLSAAGVDVGDPA